MVLPNPNSIFLPKYPDTTWEELCPLYPGSVSSSTGTAALKTVPLLHAAKLSLEGGKKSDKQMVFHWLNQA